MSFLFSIQGGSDISGTLSKLHHCFKKSHFSLILSRLTVSECWWIINKNKQTHSGKDEPAGRHKSRESLRTSRRTYCEGRLWATEISVRTLFMMKKMEVQQIGCFWRICWYVYESKISGYEEFSFSHTSWEVWGKEIRPPSSPLQPFWLFCRGRLWIKGQSKSSHKTRDLIPLIREVMGFLARNTVEKSCMRFRSRIEAVVTADHNFIE